MGIYKTNKTYSYFLINQVPVTFWAVVLGTIVLFFFPFVSPYTYIFSTISTTPFFAYYYYKKDLLQCQK